MLLCVCYLAFVAAVWLAERVIAERHWAVLLLTYMPQQPFALPGIVLAGWAIRRREWRPAAVSLAGLLWVVAALLQVNVPHRFGTPAGVPIRVMTWNVHHALGGVQRLAAVIRQEDPDILCVQEGNAIGSQPDPFSELASLLPQYRRARWGEIAVFVRGSITGAKVLPLVPAEGRWALQVDTLLHGRPLTVITIHFLTAAGSEALTYRGTRLQEYLHGARWVRAAEAKVLTGMAAKVDGPVIVAGDFNTPPRGRIYEQLTRRLRDAFHERGWGTGYTFHSRLPVMRIDYVFASDDVGVIGCHPLPVRGSDHRPVVADVVLKAP